jgi:hypothetical protein
VRKDGSPYRLSKAEANRLGTHSKFYLVDLIEARLFYPANDEMPFAFAPAEFEKRKLIYAENKRTGQYNIGEKVIKLKLNGLSGKVAQSIGGSETKPPSCYNVHYAGAIRAGTRGSIGIAAMQAPHETIQFCTDAVFSEVPLVLNEGDELGQWELEEVRDLLTVQSGVYSYTKDDKIENKTRGFAAGSVATLGIARDPAEFPEREARDVGKLGGGGKAIDLEAIENRLALEGVSDKKLEMGPDSTARLRYLQAIQH